MVKPKNRQTTKPFPTIKWAGHGFGKYRVEKVLLRHKLRPTVSLKAINKETKKPVVLKVFGSVSEISKIEFEKEIAAYKKLKNKSRHGVLTPLETFEYEGNYFIATEYKNGGDLRKWLKTKPKLTEILDIFARIAESIDYVHENKIIHRDIKPENVVYEELGEKITPYLTDFGISVTLSDTTSSFLTKHGAGTTRYMAPEFFSDKDANKTKAVDIYAFGVMLYEALEEHHPITGNKEHEIIAQIVSGIVPTPENTIKWLGKNAGSILAKALSKDPKDRPETATEIILQMDSQYIKYIGRTFDKYVVEEYIGRGPYGATYKASDLKDKSKKVALKLLFASQTRLPEISKLKELERSKGVLPIIDIGYENGVQYLVAEYINGHNLRYLFSPEGMEIQDVLEIVKPLSKTLDYLHENTIIHRNLKPENILLRKNRTDGGPQLFVDDYGISKVVGTTDALNTKNNVLLGNLNYLAPEILENKQSSPTSDVYSLGVIIYEAVEGKMPFDAESLPALIEQKSDDCVPVPRNLLKNGGIGATGILLKALNVNPEKRQRFASDLVSQLEDAIKNRAFTDKDIFVEPWVRSRKLISNLKKASLVSWVSGLLLLLICLGAFSFIPAYLASPTVTPTETSTVTFTPTITPTFTPSATPTPRPIVPTPTFVLSDKCKLPVDPLNHDYSLPNHLLLEDVFRKQFSREPDSSDLYAITYYNNRKILEGYSKYDFIDPFGLDVRRGRNIFIPPQDWIDEYKKFPITIPLSAQISSRTELDISGSSVLSHLSAQISKCSADITKVELVQMNSGNTVSGLRDLCQGKVDLFGANKEVDAEMMAEHHCGDIELEKFEVARYVMVVLINKNNPHADDVQNVPLTNEELAKLLTTARSWKDVRSYWSNSDPITRYYPSLESGGFEIVKNGVFPDLIVDGDEDDMPGLSIDDDKQSLLDSVRADANAVGIVDYDFYQDCQSKNQLIAIPVNGVYVSSAIASDNGSAYPLMATLYLYAEKNAYESNDVLRSFINYYLSHEIDFLDDLGYLYPSKKGYTGNRDTVP